MLGTILEYLAQIRPPAITTDVFPTNESDRALLSKFHCKRLPPNGEAVGHPWLLFLTWKKYNFLLLLQTFQLWISTSAALITSRLCRYYTRISFLIREVSGQRGGMTEGCNSLIYCV